MLRYTVILGLLPIYRDLGITRLFLILSDHKAGLLKVSQCFTFQYSIST